MSKFGEEAAVELHVDNPRAAKAIAADLRNALTMPLLIAEDLNEEDKEEMFAAAGQILHLADLLWGK